MVNALRLQGKRTAMGREIEYLVRHWSSMSIPFDRVVLVTPSPQEVGDLGSVTPVELVCPVSGWSNLLWEQVALPRAASGAALLFCPAYTCPILYRGEIVLANHGIYQNVPGEFSWKARVRSTPINRLSARRADHVIANSLSTKGDLAKYFGVPAQHLSVALPAASEVCFESYSAESIRQEVIQALGEDVPYVIFVGVLAKRRNVPNLIEAFGRVKAQHSLPHRLLIVGPNTQRLPLDDLIRKVGGEKVVTHIPHREILSLAKLYAGADVYALPTIYEGISMTMFEAMASGTAVLTVEHPTLAEGGADAVLAMPTPSVDDLVCGLTMLLTDSSLRAEYERKGPERAAEFSWRQNAEATMSILDRIALPCDRHKRRFG